jgi:hypothetical protein
MPELNARTALYGLDAGRKHLVLLIEGDTVQAINAHNFGSATIETIPTRLFAGIFALTGFISRE